jgi:hypothetical protein
MRLWMVPTNVMCIKHLLGEHLETHMFLGSIIRIRSLENFFAKGFLTSNLNLLRARHDQLAEELELRKPSQKEHKSPWPPQYAAPFDMNTLLQSRRPPILALHNPYTNPLGNVDPLHNLKALRARCPQCKETILAEKRQIALGIPTARSASPVKTDIRKATALPPPTIIPIAPTPTSIDQKRSKRKFPHPEPEPPPLLKLPEPPGLPELDLAFEYDEQEGLKNVSDLSVLDTALYHNNRKHGIPLDR